MKKYLMGVMGFLFLLGVDQWTKGKAVATLSGGGEKQLLGDFFVLQYLENHGAAFGILQGRQLFLICLTLAILAVVVYFYWKLPQTRQNTILRGMMVMLSAGAVGNLLDRLIRGYVVDFLYIKCIDFPIFNIADCYVVAAAAGLAVILWIGGEKTEDAVQ